MSTGERLAIIGCALALVVTIVVGSWATAAPVEDRMCDAVEGAVTEVSPQATVSCDGSQVTVETTADELSAAVEAAQAVPGVAEVEGIALPEIDPTPEPTPTVTSSAPTTPSPSPTPSDTASPTVAAPDWPVVVQFEGGSSALSSEAEDALAPVAAYLAAAPDVSVTVVGHTDNGLTRDERQDLSEQRAISVANFLAANSVAESQIETSGVGMTDPAQSNDTEAGQIANRRVEISLAEQ